MNMGPSYDNWKAGANVSKCFNCGKSHAEADRCEITDEDLENDGYEEDGNEEE